MVLKMRPYIEATRQDTLNIPSVLRAEFTREIEEMDKLRTKMNIAIRGENAKQ